ncbi:MAG TPA: hypothetical protein VKL40_15545 [Candidatus Angelobacter sp.]|nr:hypothetical protein [Candidatus Angelobacter sp.]
MLTTSQAAKIVRDCIRFVSDFSGDINMGDQLQAVGIQSANSQRSLKIEISTNSEIGVPSENHTMSTGDFSFDETSQVSDVTSQVVRKAAPAGDETA